MISNQEELRREKLCEFLVGKNYRQQTGQSWKCNFRDKWWVAGQWVMPTHTANSVAVACGHEPTSAAKLGVRFPPPLPVSPSWPNGLMKWLFRENNSPRGGKPLWWLPPASSWRLTHDIQAGLGFWARGMLGGSQPLGNFISTLPMPDLQVLH